MVCPRPCCCSGTLSRPGPQRRSLHQVRKGRFLKKDRAAGLDRVILAPTEPGKYSTVFANGAKPVACESGLLGGPAGAPGRAGARPRSTGAPDGSCAPPGCASLVGSDPGPLHRRCPCPPCRATSGIALLDSDQLLLDQIRPARRSASPSRWRGRPASSTGSERSCLRESGCSPPRSRSRTSSAAQTRPPPIFLHSVCDMTPFSDSDKESRGICAWRSAGN